jgi:hypothetical protein
MEIAMTRHREERGSCLIEAGALDLEHGRHWQPWLRLTHRTNGVCVSRTFDGLKPVFGTEQAALRYAAELGRNLADEEAVPGPAPSRREPATWSVYQAFARLHAYWSGARTCAVAHFIFR